MRFPDAKKYLIILALETVLALTLWWANPSGGRVSAPQNPCLANLVLMARLTPELLPDFERGLDARRSRIATGSFCGNDTVNALVDGFIADGRLSGRS